MRKLFFFLILTSISGWAQGSFYQLSQPMPNASVRVCTNPPTGNPCTSLASIFSDQALTQGIANPFPVGPTGNFGFWVTGGQYVIQVGPPYNQNYVISLGGGGVPVPSGNAVVGTGSSIGDSGIPFFLDPTKYSWFFDDFISGVKNTTTLTPFVTNGVGLVWATSFAGSSSTDIAIPSPAGSNGAAVFTTGAVSGNSASVLAMELVSGASLGATLTPLNATTFDVRIRAKINTTSTISLNLGFTDAAASNQIQVQYDTTKADAAWMGVCTAAGTSTRSALTGTLDTNFHDFRMRSTVAGTVLFSVDGGAETSISTNVPSAALSPYLSVTTRTTAAAIATVDFYWGWIAITR